MFVINIPKKIVGSDLIYVSLICLTLLLCLPVTICLPGLIRNLLQVLAVGGFCLGIILSKKKNLFIIFIGCVLFTLIYYYGAWSYRMSMTTYCFNAICCWVYFIGGIYYLQYGVQKKRQFLLSLVFIITTVTAVTTIFGLIRYPLAVRDLGKGDFLSDSTKFMYRKMNIAGWSQMYGMVFILPNIISAYKKNKKNYFLVSLVLCELSIIFSQLTFAMLLSAFVIIFSFYKPTKKRKFMLVEVVILEIIFMTILFLEDIVYLLSMLMKNLELSTLSIKLMDLYNLLALRKSTGDAAARFDLYNISLKTFSEHPIGGIFFSDVDSKNLISYHSEFFDMLGFFGLFGLILMLFIGGMYLKKINNKLQEKDRYFIILIFLAFIAIFVFNPVFYSPQIFLGSFLMPSLLVHNLYGKEKTYYG